jgi:hypothetical protein
LILAFENALDIASLEGGAVDFIFNTSLVGTKAVTRGTTRLRWAGLLGLLAGTIAAWEGELRTTKLVLSEETEIAFHSRWHALLIWGAANVAFRAVAIEMSSNTSIHTVNLAINRCRLGASLKNF